MIKSGTVIARTLSHCEITGKLGAGGMGVVHLARDLSLGRLGCVVRTFPESVPASALGEISRGTDSA